MGDTKSKHPELDSQYMHTKYPTDEKTSSSNRDGYFRDLAQDSSLLTAMMHLVTAHCPWLTSTEELKKRLQKVVTSVQERPMSSILYGLIVVFGFIPFAGFLLMVCGSFALLFTSFMFCQFIAVLVSALMCAGIFWVMLVGFAVLAVLLGGAVHTFMMWGILARHLRRLAHRLSVFLLQQIGIPESDLPRSPDSQKQSEE